MFKFRRLILMSNVGALIVLALALAVPTSNVHAVEPDGACYNEAGATFGTVVLDPGHGGDTDPGTSNVGTHPEGKDVMLIEKELTLDIAQRARDILDDTYKVCLTRTGDKAMSNTERAEYANSVGGTVLVLIHLNGIGDDTTNYTKTFWGKRTKDEAFSDHMYGKLWPRLDNEDGLGNLTGGGVGQFATNALLKATMEGTLTESVFLTNDREADRLADDSVHVTGNPLNRRQQIAAAIADGVTTWRGTAPSSSSGGGGGGGGGPRK